MSARRLAPIALLIAFVVVGCASADDSRVETTQVPIGEKTEESMTDATEDSTIDATEESTIDATEESTIDATEVTSSIWTGIKVSRLGANLISWSTVDFDDTTGPELVSLSESGVSGLVAATTFTDALKYFPDLDGWEKALLCNSHECLESRVARATGAGLDFDFLGYGPERLGGVPVEEKTNLPWATEVARQIADDAGKGLLISYSTKQLHMEALERGFGWDRPDLVIDLLAPHGDRWLIQAADEFNNPNDPTYGFYGPVVSQRHFPPGPEWRAEVEKWTQWIRGANPEIEIWIQIALHRIGVPEGNSPSAELAMQYREWLVNPQYGPALVEGVYISSTYSWPINSVAADEEMVKAFLETYGYGDNSPTPVPNPSPILTPTPGSGPTEVPSSTPVPTQPPFLHMNLIEEADTEGYHYWLYENPRYPCGAGDGNHEFLVLQKGTLESARNLLVKFPGGGVGFYYENDDGNRVYYPHENAIGLILARYNRNMIFRVALKDGLAKRIREREDFRLLVPSYCSHDLYYGTGQHNPIDDFQRWGYLAAMEAVDFVEQEFPTKHIITYGGSAGASGAFLIGTNQENVTGIVMDSQGVDLSGIRDACLDEQHLFGPAHPCYCPDGSDTTCMEVLGPRIGFSLGVDEPYIQVNQGIIHTPTFYIWNEYDGSRFAYRHFQNMHDALETSNPGGNSVAKKVCIDDPNAPGGGKCNLHVPTSYDYSGTIPLVNEVYEWIITLLQ
jgi:hypothetical protein